MTAAPIVSVIMAAYNGAALIPETVASLQAQTLTDFEVVIVDDCSTDTTRDVLRAIVDPRFRIIEAEVNQGPVRTRNTAVKHATGRYLAGLDQDDLCLPERFAKQVAYLDAHPDTVLVGTGAAWLDDTVVSSAPRTAVSTPALIEWLLRIENPLVWSSVMVRASAASDPFTDPVRLYAEDFDLYQRMSRVGRIARLDEELVIYRRHSGGASQRFTETMTANAARVLADSYASVFGEGSEDAAWLIIRHMMAHSPVPDRATMIALGRVLTSLQTDFLATHDVDKESLTMIRWETARRWGRVGRIALRNGTLTLADIVSARPDHLGMGYQGMEELVLSRLIGTARAAKRRLG
uniref:glycosyltransferase family 2 protein n=1 Tax=Sphingomonas sp. TaxID=28214 RepID=UPI0025CFA528|nr:glycosyltransferase family 2 protein [Sphingomonas sp.]